MDLVEKNGDNVKRKSCEIFVVCALLIISASSAVFAFPPQPHDIYGDITINGVPAAIGTVIIAKDADEAVCGTFTVTSEGIYGFLHINGDDDGTLNDEGALSGDNVTFHVDRLKAVSSLIVKFLQIWQKNLSRSWFLVPGYWFNE